MGNPLPPGQYRGTIEWLIFQNILIECLEELGHEIFEQLETPLVNDRIGVIHGCGTWLPDFDKCIYVHQTKHDKHEGDLFWMQMHMRELFTIDTNGWGADHSGNNLFNPKEVDQDEATRFCHEKSAYLISNGSSKCDQPRDTDSTPESYILIPIQIPRDATIKHHSPITVRYFIESIQAWAIETKTQVCFKMHPHNQGDRDLHQIVEEAQASSPYVRKVEGNIHELIRRSSGVLVINSGTGFESLLHGKPVATIGDCDYRAATFNADIRKLDAVSRFFREYGEFERQLAYRFVYWYWHQHAYDVNAPNTPSRLTEYLKGVL